MNIVQIQEACTLVEVADTETLEALFTLASGRADALRREQSARLKDESHLIDAYARLAHACRMRLESAAYARLGQGVPRSTWTAEIVGELPRDWLVPDSVKIRAYLAQHEGKDVPPAVPGLNFRRIL